MSIRNLLRIILKVIGLLFVRDIIISIPQLLSTTLVVARSQDGMLFYSILAALLIMASYFIAANYLLRHTDWIIDRMDLEKGFDETHVQLKLHRSTVLSICLIVIGGYLVAATLPGLALRLWEYTQPAPSLFFETKPGFGYFLPDIVKVFLGICLMVYHRFIVNLIEQRRVERNNEEVEDVPVEKGENILG